ncbi:hypothetical protein AB0D56_37230 [Streptomyces sp. NPDC048209]|uniref:hypothetical protein n=1 Tax=Streptomyces sp. NPDC048209 TaxID=3156689 RepID=UPI003434D765
MNSTVVDDWSPADNPYAIALSEAQWWQRTAALAVRRIHADDEDGDPFFSSRQIDARQLCIALHQLLVAEKLEQTALKELGIDPTVGQSLTQAREHFEATLPGVKHMRDGLTHFEDWSRGKGRGPQKERLKARDEPRDVARAYWSFAYDPQADTVTMGPYQIQVSAVDEAAGELAYAIYLAAHEVDRRNTARFRTTVLQALTDAGIPVGPEEAVRVSAGDDGRVWLSFTPGVLDGEPARQELAERAVAALTAAALRLAESTPLQPEESVPRLVGWQSLRVEPASAVRPPRTGQEPK